LFRTGDCAVHFTPTSPAFLRAVTKVVRTVHCAAPSQETPHHVITHAAGGGHLNLPSAHRFPSGWSAGARGYGDMAGLTALSNHLPFPFFAPAST
ncbi:MAG: hypothetical protein RL077_942, partial [Verrucomicrobiota bacterium]